MYKKLCLILIGAAITASAFVFGPSLLSQNQTNQKEKTASDKHKQEEIIDKNYVTTHTSSAAKLGYTKGWVDERDNKTINLQKVEQDAKILHRELKETEPVSSYVEIYKNGYNVGRSGYLFEIEQSAYAELKED